MSNDQSFKNRKPAMGKAEPGTIKRIFSYIFQYKWRVIAIVVCILVGAAAQAVPRCSSSRSSTRTSCRWWGSRTPTGPRCCGPSA